MNAQDVRRESGISYIRWLIVAFIWVSAFCILVPLGMSIAPDLEAALLPPLKDQKISERHIKSGDPDFMLFRWRGYKSRRATPLFYSLMGYPADAPTERVPLEVFTNWDCDRNFQADRANPPNQEFNREICVRLPKKWSGRTDILVDGWAEYKVGHGLYTVPQRIP